MAKLYSPITEGFAIRTLCSTDQTVSGLMMASVDESYFRDPRAKTAYEAIREYSGENGHPPRFRLLCENISVPEKVRTYLKDIQSAAKTKEEVREITQRLTQYRKARMLYDMSKSVYTALEESQVDLDEVMSTAELALQSARSDRDVEAHIFNVNRNNSADAVVKEILSRSKDDFFIPTGLKAWDEVNSGIPRGSLLTIGGSSGAGKSHSIVSLVEYQVRHGYKATVIPLELSESEWMARFLANITGIDSLRISTNDLTAEEREYIDRKYTRWKKKAKAAGGWLSVYVPPHDVSIEEVFAVVGASNPDLIYVDYLGLLKGADGEDQWRKLGQIARVSKVHAGNTGRVVGLAAQVDDNGRLRYSQAVKEHSSVAWSFVATKTTKETGILAFNTFKSRNLVALDFSVRIEYEFSRLSTLSREEAASLMEPEGRASREESNRPKPKKDRGRDDADHYKFKRSRPSHEDVSDAVYRRSRKEIVDDVAEPS